MEGTSLCWKNDRFFFFFIIFTTGSWGISPNHLRFWTLIWFLPTSAGARGISHHVKCTRCVWVCAYRLESKVRGKNLPFCCFSLRPLFCVISWLTGTFNSFGTKARIKARSALDFSCQARVSYFWHEGITTEHLLFFIIIRSQTNVYLSQTLHHISGTVCIWKIENTTWNNLFEGGEKYQFASQIYSTTK